MYIVCLGWSRYDESCPGYICGHMIIKMSRETVAVLKPLDLLHEHVLFIPRGHLFWYHVLFPETWRTSNSICTCDGIHVTFTGELGMHGHVLVYCWPLPACLQYGWSGREQAANYESQIMSKFAVWGQLSTPQRANQKVSASVAWNQWNMYTSKKMKHQPNQSKISLTCVWFFLVLVLCCRGKWTWSVGVNVMWII